MNENAPGTICLVTGAARGIGLEVARQLAGRGMSVLLTARDMANAQVAARELSGGGSIQAYALDVADPESVRRLAGEIERNHGRLDVLINNAAAFSNWSEVASSTDLDAAHEVLETNLFGAWRVIQGLLPALRRGVDPRIVNVSSGAGSHGDQRFGLSTNGGAQASYGISKAALNALTSQLAAELASDGILVNAVCPGLTATAPGMDAMGARPVADGAAGVVWAAMLPPNGPSGGFFRDGQPIPW